MKFTVLNTSGSARLGRLTLGAIDIDTPVFMPVGTMGSVRTLEAREVWELGFRLILGNTYHLSLKPGADTVRHFGGLKKFMNWPGAILTDSGGFQVFSLARIRKLDDDGVTFSSPVDGGAEHRLTPESALDIQRALGSDIAMLLDECPPHPCEPAALRAAVARTIDWAERARRAIAQNPMPDAAFAISQGGLDAGLRRDCVSRLVDMDFPGYAIGGLSVGEPLERMVEHLDQTMDGYPADKPRYFMGLGTPIDILDCVMRGVDMFDCVWPTRNARRGQLMTSTGPLNITNQPYARDESPIDPACPCRICSTYSRGYIRHLFNAGEHLAMKLATYHNLAWMAAFMSRIRAAIASDTLPALRAEMRDGWERAL